MATLVFDIETCGHSADQFDDAQREYLFRDALAEADEEVAREKREAVEQMMSLWPLTSQVLCIAMVNADTGRGKVLYVAEDHEEGEAGGAVEFQACVDEGELLGVFWDAAKHYERVVTFNGRGFDVPFLYLKSAQLGIPISRKNWLGYRFTAEPHCDLADQLTFYGVSGRDGAARRFNLDFYCKAFGIESPKSRGVSGMDVRRLRDEGRQREIAEYCLRDVEATVQLFKLWQERLAGIK